MIPTTAILDGLVTDVLAGTLTGTCNVKLSKASFTPSNQTGWVEADFPGYAPKVGVDWVDGVDALSQVRTLRLNPPVGGFRFVAASNLTEQQTIFGFRVEYANGTLIGSALLTPPAVIAVPGAQLVLDTVYFVLVNPIFE